DVDSGVVGSALLIAVRVALLFETRQSAAIEIDFGLLRLRLLFDRVFTLARIVALVALLRSARDAHKVRDGFREYEFGRLGAGPASRRVERIDRLPVIEGDHSRSLAHRPIGERMLAAFAAVNLR